MIGITFYYGYATSPKIRAEHIKNHGFDTVMTSPDRKFNRENSNILRQIKLFKKNGLKLSSLHSSYNSKELPCFWEEGRRGDKIEKNLKKEVKLAKKLGFTCLVVHTGGTYSEIGKQRLLRILDVCEKYDLPIAIENLESERLFRDIFSNIEHKYMGLCYDVGHNHCFSPNFDVLGEYGDKLLTLHLHDNMGKHDDHTLNLFGDINWDEVARKLARCKECNLDYELLMPDTHGLTEEECLDLCFKQGKELEFLIDKYRREDLDQIKMTFI